MKSKIGIYILQNWKISKFLILINRVYFCLRHSKLPAWSASTRKCCSRRTRFAAETSTKKRPATATRSGLWAFCWSRCPRWTRRTRTASSRSHAEFWKKPRQIFENRGTIHQLLVFVTQRENLASSPLIEYIIINYRTEKNLRYIYQRAEDIWETERERWYPRGLAVFVTRAQIVLLLPTFRFWIKHIFDAHSQIYVRRRNCANV